MATKVKKRTCTNKWDGFIQRCTKYRITGKHKCRFDDETHSGPCQCACNVQQS